MCSRAFVAFIPQDFDVYKHLPIVAQNLVSRLKSHIKETTHYDEDSIEVPKDYGFIVNYGNKWCDVIGQDGAMTRLQSKSSST